MGHPGFSQTEKHDATLKANLPRYQGLLRMSPAGTLRNREFYGENAASSSMFSPAAALLRL
jgi:hypothetical protein